MQNAKGKMQKVNKIENQFTIYNSHFAIHTINKGA